jgi:hypothetical protein
MVTTAMQWCIITLGTTTTWNKGGSRMHYMDDIQRARTVSPRRIKTQHDPKSKNNDNDTCPAVADLAGCTRQDGNHGVAKAPR